MNMMIPLGYRFMPTDEELITSYLLRRARGLPLTPTGADHQHIVEKPLYGDMADPWHVFQDVADSHWDISEEDDSKKDKRVIYVITKLSKVSKGKTRIARRAGCGTWSGQTVPKRIENESGQWVGSMRMYEFKRRDPCAVRDPRDQHHWNMHEYSLDGAIYSNNCQIKHQDYVICKITRVSSSSSSSSSSSCLQLQQQQPKSVSGNKRSCDHQGIIAAAACHDHDKKQKKAMVSSEDEDISRSSSSFFMQPPDHMMFDGSSPLNVLTAEEFEIMHATEFRCSSSSGQSMQGQPPNHQVMLAEPSSPAGSTCSFREWAEEDFNTLNDDKEEGAEIGSFSSGVLQQSAGQSIQPADHRFLSAQVMLPKLPLSWTEKGFDITKLIDLGV